jgi:hypothetical protein
MRSDPLILAETTLGGIFGGPNTLWGGCRVVINGEDFK